MIGIDHVEQNNDGNTVENRLIQSVKSFVFGKHESFAYIYEKTAPHLMAICKRYAANQDDAKDILQDAFIKIYKNLYQFDYNASFDFWTRRITINTAIDYYRKNINRTFQSVHEIELEDDTDVYVSNQFLNLDIDLVLKSIQELPDGYRIILNLFVFENKSHKEIAEFLQISESTSRSQLSKARKSLKEKFAYESK